MNERINNYTKKYYKKLAKTVISLEPYIKNGTVLDIGSNIGLFSKAICDNIPYENIYLFEPCKELYDHSKELLKNNNNVFFYNTAIGDQNGTIEIYKSTNANIGWNTILKKDPKQEDNFYLTMDKEICSINRLDDLCKNINKIDFIKIDVEGYERYVLLGGMALIKKFKPYMYIEVGWGTKHPEWFENEKIYNELFSIGYKQVKFTDKTKDILFECEKEK